jgi:hypothetical protein
LVGSRIASDSGQTLARSVNPGQAACLALCLAALLVLVGQRRARADQDKILTAEISGPGLSDPVRLRLGDVFTLEADLAVVPTRLGAAALEPPTNQLGPSYEIVCYDQLVDGRSFTLRQEFYPYAVGGPVVFTRPGQRFFNTAYGGAFPVASGWTRSIGTTDAYRFLSSRGLPGRTASPSRGWIVLLLVSPLIVLAIIWLVRKRQRG